MILVSFEFTRRSNELHLYIGRYHHNYSAMNTQFILLVCVVLVAAFLTTPASANRVGTCMRNCAQCTKMFGPYFDGELCADTCVKFKGKMIPDCEDENSIAPFISRLDDI